MSHQPQRTEKDCLNCGSIVESRYCSACGQENIITKQSAFAMVKHFVYDIFHFDGKFFDTLRPLLFKPGSVPANYITGKRLKYLDPIRMYLFTSAIFFLIFFSFKKVEVNVSDWGKVLSKAERAEAAMALNTQAKQGTIDSFGVKALNRLLDSTQTIIMLKADSTDTDSLIKFRGVAYKMISAVDSLEWKEEKDLKSAGWLEKKFIQRTRAMKVKYGGDLGEGFQNLMETFVHRLPYMLFISLPFFALILKLLYVRKKGFYYSDHLVFTLYHYIFSFILLLIFFGVAGLKHLLGLGIFGWIMFLLIVAGGVYLYKGMRTFYEEGRGKTIWKFIVLNFLRFLSLLILLITFLIFTAFQL